MTARRQAAQDRARIGTSFAFLVAVFAALGVAAVGRHARAADVSIKPGDQVVRAKVQTEAQLQAIEALNLDIWSHEYGVGPIEIHVSAAERQALTNAGLTFDVIIDDLVAAYEASQGGLEGGGPWTEYMDFPALIAFINNLAALRPDLCQVMDIGDTIEDRDIWVLKITGPGPGPKPGVFLHGLQHAREWITGPILPYFANHLISNYDTDPCIRELVNNSEIYLAPCVNPDGYTYSWINSSTRLWRKNRRDNGDGTFGVDLNRNWAYGWGGGGSSGSPGNDVYRGTAPFSEPETTALSNFISAHPNITAYLDYHSYAQQLMWPFGTVCTPPPEPDASWFALHGSRMRSELFTIHSRSYVTGPLCPTLYQASGISVDWVYATAGRDAFTIELPPTGSPGFVLPPDQILPVCEENLPALLYLTRLASSGLFFEFATAPPSALVANQANDLKLRITSNLEDYFPGSGMLHYRVGVNGPFTATPLVHLGADLFTATIPAHPCGTLIQYHLSASGDGGYQAVLPCDAPNSLFTTTFANQRFNDSFETNQGWTASINGATAGAWQRGVPLGNSSGFPIPTSDADGSGQCYLTQISPASADVDNGSVILTSPTIDMSGGNVSIVYARFLGLSNYDGIDRLLVEINTNDGVGPWTQINLHSAFTVPTWDWVTIDQASLTAAGVSPSAVTRLRFTANDSNPQSTVEAGVDAVRVYVHCAAACPTLLGDMNSDSSLNGRDITGFVDANLLPPNYHPCADMAAPTGVLDSADLTAFVAALLGS